MKKIKLVRNVFDYTPGLLIKTFDELQKGDFAYDTEITGGGIPGLVIGFVKTKRKYKNAHGHVTYEVTGDRGKYKTIRSEQAEKKYPDVVRFRVEKDISYPKTVESWIAGNLPSDIFADYLEEIGVPDSHQSLFVGKTLEALRTKEYEFAGESNRLKRVDIAAKLKKEKYF